MASEARAAYTPPTWVLRNAGALTSSIPVSNPEWEVGTSVLIRTSPVAK